jgi:hypothetical protein
VLGVFLLGRAQGIEVASGGPGCGRRRVAYRYDGWGLGTRTCSRGHRGVRWRSGILYVIVSRGIERVVLLDLEGVVGAQWDSHNRLVPAQPTRSSTKSTPL